MLTVTSTHRSMSNQLDRGSKTFQVHDVARIPRESSMGNELFIYRGRKLCTTQTESIDAVRLYDSIHVSIFTSRPIDTAAASPTECAQTDELCE